MAKVVAPLFSLKATGTLAGAITFVCGQYARMAERKENEKKQGNENQMAKFTLGAEHWQALPDGTKKLWNDFYKEILSSEQCLNITYDLSGYNMWMIYWLKFGENGWADYPLPGSAPSKK